MMKQPGSRPSRRGKTGGWPVATGSCHEKMCGIIGCTLGNDEAPGILLDGLKRLEYRGYDSSGIAVLQGGSVHTVREVGKIANLEKALGGLDIRGRTGVGHTRWATHGAPSTRNAHPHGDAAGALVVVHNGIIENYLEIRHRLEAAGDVFSSETDSEVVAHHIAHHYRGDLLEAVRATVGELEGTYALAVIHKDHPDVVVGAVKESPLVVGLGSGANYLASDTAALLALTRDVIYLEDGELVEIRPEGVRIIDMGGAEIRRSPVTVTWTAAQAEKAGFDHYMLKEIHEQPTTVSDCLLGRMANDDGEIVLEGLGLNDEKLKALDRIQIVACGTSWHAGQAGRFFLEEFGRVPVDVDYASEFVGRAPVLGPDTLLLAISQSGETADTRSALRRGKEEFGVPAVAICNVAGSSMAREADGVILTHAGPEIGVASTKAFMGQLTALLLLALRIGQARGVLSRERVQEVCSALRALPQEIEAVLRTGEQIRELAEIYKSARDFLFIGRGVNYPIALEGALKLKEISYNHAEGYPAGEMKHGPIALIDNDMPILAIATEGKNYAMIAGNVAEARARGGRILALVNPGDRRVASEAEHVIEVPCVPEWLSPMVNIVPLQLLAYWIARKRGADVDQPRNLAKTVTVH